jgi:hypothetical protein
MKNCTAFLLHFVKIGLVVAVMSPLAATAPASAQGIEMWNKPCLKFYKKWKQFAKHKAFAVSNSSAGGGIGQSCGYSYDYPTKAGAEVAAVKSCEQEKKYRSGRCYVMKSE